MSLDSANPIDSLPDASPAGLPDPVSGDTPLPHNRFVRLMWLGGVLLAILSGSAILGYYRDKAAKPSDSQTYINAMDYAAQIAPESEFFEASIEPIIDIPGSAIASVDTLPADTMMRQLATLEVRTTPRALAQDLAARWRAQGMQVETYGKDKTQMVTATPRKGTKSEIIMVSAEIEGHQTIPGGSVAAMTLVRHPRDHENQWFHLPEGLPELPAGSKLAVRGGAMGDVERGRAYSIEVPLSVDVTMDYFIPRLEALGWTVDRGAPPGKHDDQKIRAFLLSKGSAGYTLNFSPMSGQLAKTMVVFMGY